jgi:hypothetical protein
MGMMESWNTGMLGADASGQIRQSASPFCPTIFHYSIDRGIMAKIVKMKTPDILGKLKGPGKSHLGIDMGSQTIKIVELRSTPRGMDLVHHALWPWRILST